MRHTVTVLLLAALASAPAMVPAADPFWGLDRSDTAHAITVYRTPYCGCCEGWVAHLREHRFEVDEVVLDDLVPVRRSLGVAPELASCHTAVADGHVFEGHVPANDVKAVLERDDEVRLLSVPAMPSGTPGMDFPGARKDAFEVVAEDRDGTRRVYKRYAGY